MMSGEDHTTIIFKIEISHFAPESHATEDVSRSRSGNDTGGTSPQKATSLKISSAVTEGISCN